MNSPLPNRRFSRWQTRKRTFVLGGGPKQLQSSGDENTRIKSPASNYTTDKLIDNKKKESVPNGDQESGIPIVTNQDALPICDPIDSANSNSRRMFTNSALERNKEETEFRNDKYRKAETDDLGGTNPQKVKQPDLIPIDKSVEGNNSKSKSEAEVTISSVTNQNAPQVCDLTDDSDANTEKNLAKSIFESNGEEAVSGNDKHTKVEIHRRQGSGNKQAEADNFEKDGQTNLTCKNNSVGDDKAKVAYNFPKDSDISHNVGSSNEADSCNESKKAAALDRSPEEIISSGINQYAPPICDPIDSSSNIEHGKKLANSVLENSRGLTEFNTSSAADNASIADDLEKHTSLLHSSVNEKGMNRSLRNRNSIRKPPPSSYPTEFLSSSQKKSSSSKDSKSKPSRKTNSESLISLINPQSSEANFTQRSKPEPAQNINEKKKRAHVTDTLSDSTTVSESILVVSHPLPDLKNSVHKGLETNEEIENTYGHLTKKSSVRRNDKVYKSQLALRDKSDNVVASMGQAIAKPSEEEPSRVPSLRKRDSLGKPPPSLNPEVSLSSRKNRSSQLSKTRKMLFKSSSPKKTSATNSESKSKRKFHLSSTEQSQTAICTEAVIHRQPDSGNINTETNIEKENLSHLISIDKSVLAQNSSKDDVVSSTDNDQERKKSMPSYNHSEEGISSVTNQLAPPIDTSVANIGKRLANSILGSCREETKFRNVSVSSNSKKDRTFIANESDKQTASLHQSFNNQKEVNRSLRNRNSIRKPPPRSYPTEFLSSSQKKSSIPKVSKSDSSKKNGSDEGEQSTVKPSEDTSHGSIVNPPLSLSSEEFLSSKKIKNSKSSLTRKILFNSSISTKCSEISSESKTNRTAKQSVTEHSHIESVTCGGTDVHHQEKSGSRKVENSFDIEKQSKSKSANKFVDSNKSKRFQSSLNKHRNISHDIGSTIEAGITVDSLTNTTKMKSIDKAVSVTVQSPKASDRLMSNNSTESKDTTNSLNRNTKFSRKNSNQSSKEKVVDQVTASLRQEKTSGVEKNQENPVALVGISISPSNTEPSNESRSLRNRSSIRKPPPACYPVEYLTSHQAKALSLIVSKKRSSKEEGHQSKKGIRKVNGKRQYQLPRKRSAKKVLVSMPTPESSHNAVDSTLVSASFEVVDTPAIENKDHRLKSSIQKSNEDSEIGSQVAGSQPLEDTIHGIHRKRRKRNLFSEYDDSASQSEIKIAKKGQRKQHGREKAISQDDIPHVIDNIMPDESKSKVVTKDELRKPAKSEYKHIRHEANLSGGTRKRNAGVSEGQVPITRQVVDLKTEQAVRDWMSSYRHFIRQLAMP